MILKPIDYKEYRDMAIDFYERALAQVNICKVVQLALKPWNGKKLKIDAVQEIQDLLPRYHVQLASDRKFQKNFRDPMVEVWGNEVDYTYRCIFILKTDSNGIFNYWDFIDTCAFYAMAEAHVKAYDSCKDNLQVLVEQWNSMIQPVQDLKLELDKIMPMGNYLKG